MRRIRRYFSRRAESNQQEVHGLNVRQVLESQSAKQILNIRQQLTELSSAAGARVEIDQRSFALLEEGSTPSEHEPLSEYHLNECFLAKAVQVHPACNPHPDALLALRWTASALKELRLEVRSSSSRTDSSHTSALSGESALRVQDRDCSTDADEALQLFYEVVSLTNDQLSLQHATHATPSSPPGLSKEAATTLLNALYLAHLPDPLNTAEETDNSRPERSMLHSVLAGALAAHKILSALTWILAPGSRRRGAEHFCNAVVAAVGGIAFTGVCRISRMMISEPGRRRSMASVGDQNSMMTTVTVQCPLCREHILVSHAIRNVRAGDSVPACCVCTEAISNVCLPCGHLCLCQTCFAQMPRQSVQAVPAV